MEVCFADTSAGWIVGIEIQDTIDIFTIFHTNDGGVTWLSQWEWTASEPHGICFTDANMGWVVGGGMTGPGIILHTTDGGSIWSTQSSGIINGLNDVYFTDESNGWAIGWAGTIIYTTDSGTSWVSQTSGTNEAFYGIHFANVSMGWVVGTSGTILHTTNGGVTFVEEEQINDAPTEFLLLPNYPNPFNSTTQLSYSITKSSLVTLKVYDVLGTEIKTLVNEEKPIGTYELTWNAANLPSGVYFYKLKAGSFVQTRKMILLK